MTIQSTVISFTYSYYRQLCQQQNATLSHYSRFQHCQNKRIFPSDWEMDGCRQAGRAPRALPCQPTTLPLRHVPGCTASHTDVVVQTAPFDCSSTRCLSSGILPENVTPVTCSKFQAQLHCSSRKAAVVRLNLEGLSVYPNTHKVIR